MLLINQGPSNGPGNVTLQIPKLLPSSLSQTASGISLRGYNTSRSVMPMYGWTIASIFFVMDGIVRRTHGIVACMCEAMFLLLYTVPIKIKFDHGWL